MDLIPYDQNKRIMEAQTAKTKDQKTVIKMVTTVEQAMEMLSLRSKEKVIWQKVRPLYLRDGGKSSPDRSRRITFSPKVPLYEKDSMTCR